MLRVDRPRLIGKRYEEKAAWELETHEALYKGEMVPATTWLLSDGRLLGGAAWRDVLADESDAAVLEAILAGLERIGSRRDDDPQIAESA
jgi:hypothetical protein